MRRWARWAALGAGVAVGAGLVPGPTAPAEADAGGAKAVRCREGAGVDPAGDVPALDVVRVEMWLACDAADWTIVVTTADRWRAEVFDSLQVWIDADDDPGTGCEGDDFVVWAPAGFQPVVTATPGCDDRAWRDVGTPRVELTDGAVVAHVPRRAIGDPAGAVQYWVVLTGPHGNDIATGAAGRVRVLAESARPVAAPSPVQVLEAGPRFDNGRCQIPVDATEVRHSVTRLYLAYFLRQPDPPGLDYWSDRYGSGQMCLAEVSDWFAQSPEFVTTYGSLDIPGFLRLAYLNVFGREPDPEGYLHWAHHLASGAPRGDVMAQLAESVEFRIRTGVG